MGFLFNPVDIILLARTSFRIVAFHIAKDAVADAHVFVGINAQFGEDGLTFGRFKLFFRTVDPA